MGLGVLGGLGFRVEGVGFGFGEPWRCGKRIVGLRGFSACELVVFGLDLEARSAGSLRTGSRDSDVFHYHTFFSKAYSRIAPPIAA